MMRPLAWSAVARPVGGSVHHLEALDDLDRSPRAPGRGRGRLVGICNHSPAGCGGRGGGRPRGRARRHGRAGGHCHRHSWRPYAPAEEARQIVTEWSLPGELSFETDPVLLGRVAANVFDNAVSYTNPGGRIRIRVTGGGREPVRIEVKNTGSSLTAGEALEATAAFWRHDAARTESDHTGLGLTLTDTIVTLLDGTLTLGSEPGGQFTAVVELPGGGQG